jgi:MoaA/NifB/PqqE/SkfB family radical SAM enzyme
MALNPPLADPLLANRGPAALPTIAPLPCDATPRHVRILYRGPLASCNYDCRYCPFAKRHETAAELKRDEAALARFVDWVARESSLELSILFTPWGEALIRRWYQQALARLSHLPHLRRVAIQTNLSCQLDWLMDCDLSRLSLWCTWHPTQIPLDEFLGQTRELETRGVRYSVGVVGLREAIDAIDELRSRLPASVYLWINAYKDEPNYYRPGEIERLTSIDPHFRTNLADHPSRGMHCLAGETSLAVDGEGNIRRCHFVPEVLGNLYESNWQRVLARRTCPNDTCGCHIGYVNLPQLGQESLYGDGLLARIPERVR